ncbi:hypothetical protein WA026_005874 [Henosepilachna vigintioctopunctata]|uniref:BolA-like protein n=2 Tax=Henosepilachna vigintioctopunctata TaxID=420089 RepID=A0AAW1TXS9_9CUCU
MSSIISKRLLYKNSNIKCNYWQSLLSKMSSNNSVEASIRNKMIQNLGPTFLNVMNESYMHNVPSGSETHFKLVIVSEHFLNLPNVKRHQLIYNLLKDEMQNGVHALSIVAKTPQEWDTADKNIEPSPNCRGGFGK